MVKVVNKKRTLWDFLEESGGNELSPQHSYYH